MAWKFENEDDVRDYVENIGIEYRFSCYHEKKPEGCHLLADYLEAIKKDFKKAANVYKQTCDDYNFGKSCNKFAGYLMNGKGCSPDSGEALHYYKKGCDNDCPAACFAAGFMESTAWESHRPNLETSLKYFDKGCSGNDARACFHASGLLLKGDDNSPVKRDPCKAFRYAEKACDMGLVQACANVSIMYSRGDGVEKNDELASKYKKIALQIQEQTKKHVTPIVFS